MTDLLFKVVMSFFFFAMISCNDKKIQPFKRELAEDPRDLNGETESDNNSDFNEKSKSSSTAKAESSIRPTPEPTLEPTPVAGATISVKDFIDEFNSSSNSFIEYRDTKTREVLNEGLLPDVLGNHRLISVVNDQGLMGYIDLYIGSGIVPGKLYFKGLGNVPVTAVLQYGSNLKPLNANFTGKSGIVLSARGDVGYDIVVSVVTGAYTGEMTLAISASPGGVFSKVEARFSEFTNANDLNLSDIDQIILKVSVKNYADLVIDYIRPLN